MEHFPGEVVVAHEALVGGRPIVDIFGGRGGQDIPVIFDHALIVRHWHKGGNTAVHCQAKGFRALTVAAGYLGHFGGADAEVGGDEGTYWWYALGPEHLHTRGVVVVVVVVVVVAVVCVCV